MVEIAHDDKIRQTIYDYKSKLMNHRRSIFGFERRIMTITWLTEDIIL